MAAIRLLALSSALLIIVSCQSAPQTQQEPSVERQTVQPAVSVVEETDELNKKERLAWLQARKNYFKSLYQERLDPYFGKSDEQVVSCESKSVKQVDEKSNGDAAYVSYLILTTDAGATGVCDSKMQTHRMALVFAACANRALQFTLKVVCPGSADLDSSECRISEQQISRYCFDRTLNGARI
jgi:hypothetical protein